MLKQKSNNNFQEKNKKAQQTLKDAHKEDDPGSVLASNR